jgi:hypothetical protein
VPSHQPCCCSSEGSASLLVGQSVFGNALPILANAPPTPFLVIWGMIYPLLLLGSAVYVFAQRDL